MLVQWYSNHLRTFIEPLLFNKKIDREIYRFLWLRTFNNPVLIRIEKSNKDFKLFWKVTNGAGGYKPGNLILNKEKKITEYDWNSFLKLIDISNFWKMKTVKVDIPGNDGAQWILEAQSDGKYQVVDRWTPQQGDFYDCCDFLIKLTDLNIEKKNKY